MYVLFENYFTYAVPTIMAKTLFETTIKKKNSDLVKIIKVRWSCLKDEIKKCLKMKKKLKNQVKYQTLSKKF